MEREQGQVVRDASAEALPGLRIIIRDKGETVKAVFLSDPRQEYMEVFNERCKGMGLVASLN
jgi:hypothetical protein